jgi:RNA polymerase sigma factor (sigma-70 family)
MSHSSGSGYNRKNITDEAIILGILHQDEALIGAVYRLYYPKIKKMVYTFRNTALDPDGIFHEGLTRAVTNIREGKFRRESSFLTYLNGICRIICLKELKRKHTVQIDRYDFPVENESYDFDTLNLLLKVKERLEEKCRNIIDLRFGFDDSESGKTIPFEEVARILDMTADNARQRFKRCLDKLREFIMGNSDLKNLF